MAYIRQRITIMDIQKPRDHNINTDLQWLGTSLGLIGLRDRDRSCFRIFIELLKYAKHNRPLSSDELAYNLHLSRGTVVHHLRKLLEAGMVVNDRNRYVLRVNTLRQLIHEIQRDTERTLEELREAAKLLDQQLGLEGKRESTLE